MIGAFGKGDISVFRSFPMNFQYLSCAIDLREFNPQGLLKPETAGIDSDQVNIIMKCCNVRKDFSYFLNGQDFRKFLRALGPDDIQQVPVSFQDILKKNLMPE